MPSGFTHCGAQYLVDNTGFQKCELFLAASIQNIISLGHTDQP